MNNHKTENIEILNRRPTQTCADRLRAKINREIYADDRRLFNLATRAIKRYVIPLARDKNIIEA